MGRCGANRPAVPSRFPFSTLEALVHNKARNVILLMHRPGPFSLPQSARVPSPCMEVDEHGPGQRETLGDGESC